MALTEIPELTVQHCDGLRGWLDEVQRMGELLQVKGSHWDVEMGTITHMLTEKSGGTAPAILFDAYIPYDMKLKNKFPTVVDVSGDLRPKLRAKFPHIVPSM